MYASQALYIWVSLPDLSFPCWNLFFYRYFCHPWRQQWISRVWILTATTFAISLAGSPLEPPICLPQLFSLMGSSLNKGGGVLFISRLISSVVWQVQTHMTPRHHQDYPNTHMTPIHTLQTWDIESPVFIACFLLPARGGSCRLAWQATVVYFPWFQETHLDL